MLPGPAVPGCCLISFHFLWAIHPIRPVLSWPLSPQVYRAIALLFPSSITEMIRGEFDFSISLFFLRMPPPPPPPFVAPAASARLVSSSLEGEPRLRGGVGGRARFRAIVLATSSRGIMPIDFKVTNTNIRLDDRICVMTSLLCLSSCYDGPRSNRSQPKHVCDLRGGCSVRCVLCACPDCERKSENGCWTKRPKKRP